MDFNELADKFLNDQLNEQERTQFDELLKNPDFMESTYLSVLLKQSFKKNDDLQFLRTLKEVEQTFYYQQSYTLEELLACFSPVQEYEDNLSTVSRASDVEILHPKNHINCVDNLYFEWSKPNHIPLLLIIENNEYDVLIRKEIPIQTLSFSINLDFKKGFKPGRYYWKLTSKRHEISAIGAFFIAKDLLKRT